MAIHFYGKPEKYFKRQSRADMALACYPANLASSKYNIFQAYLNGDFRGEENKILPINEIDDIADIKAE